MGYENIICKIFGAGFWHDSVEIMGNKQALIRLRDAIDRAIEGGTGKAELMESDGEGYYANVYCEDRDWEEWSKLPIHYTDEELTGGNTEEQEDEFLKIVRDNS